MDFPHQHGARLLFAVRTVRQSGSRIVRVAVRLISSAVMLAVVLTGPLFPGAAIAEPGLSLVNPVLLARLPVEAQMTYRLVQSGGPFPYSKDGIVFANRERSLPQKPRGFYREYTVRTPGSGDRGARRIVCGGYRTSRPDACFYTSDHYSSFRQITQ